MKTKIIRAHYNHQQAAEILARQLISDKEPHYQGEAKIQMTMMINTSTKPGTIRRIQIEADLKNLRADL